ncbi:MAG: hypothetical protein GF398_11875 [Chitinivibrionales bacterium]|nr:hypothetical protein [Chitinivibrionales bacterium]
MQRSITMLIAGLLAASQFTGCGLNPFGAGKSGLRWAAVVGKSVEKPPINEEENSEESAKKKLAVAQVNRLAKSAAIDAGIVSRSIEDSANVFIYRETVNNKPAEHDFGKLITGTGTVAFKTTQTTITSVDDIDETKITDILRWHFKGREYKTWKKVTDSLEISVEFAKTKLAEVKPGETSVWGLNISDEKEKGRDDSAWVYLSEADDANQTQTGSGIFKDAHSGEDNTGPARYFHFQTQIIHKNALDSGKPYERWEDNEGVMEFKTAWDATGDSLYFYILFSPVNSTDPQTIDYKREGSVYENDKSGNKLLDFVAYEKSGEGNYTIYDDNGEVIEHKVF